jgi:O-antigen ligase
VADFGLPTAVSFYRQSFYVASVLFYSLTIDWTPERLERLVKMWLVVGLMLACLTILEWLFDNVIPRGVTWNFKSLYVFDQGRVLPAASALIMAQAGIAGLAVWSQARSSVLMRVLSIFLLAIAFGLFHRSVWMAAAAGIAVLLAFSRESLIRVVPFIGLGMAAAAVLWMFQQGLGGYFLTRAVQSAVQEPFAEDSSLAWRITGWELLLERAFSSGLETVIFGAGYGAGYERQIGWSTVLYSPHNFYIATLLDTGLIGVGLWVYGFARIGLGLLGHLPPGISVLRPGLMALFATIVVYNIPYSHLTEQGLWLGALASTSALFAGRGVATVRLAARP